ncbi:MAG: DMT family transporter [Coriobacteriia bacterium]|nr:DMT family transporter [Coriobacteriia bacterium]
MLTALLSLATSTLFGVGDFLGGFASKRESPVNVTANAHVVGFVLFTLGLLLFPAPFAWHDVRMGLISGVSGGVGVGALYAALARGRMSIVAPITAALSGSLPAAYDFIQGTQVGPFAIAGLALALVATIIVSASSGEAEEGQKEMPPSALWLSFLAGFGFSGGFIAFSLASPASGMWPLASARVTSMLLFAALALITTRRLSVDRTVRLQTFGAGVTDAAANITMITAIRIGPLAIASVLGSLYPVVTILLARIVLGERLRPLQWFGVLLALVAVILAALP